jgi:uncharacterized protein (DUF2225 family)
MRKYTKKPRVIEEREVLSEVSCDLCGKVGRYGDWESSNWEVAESEIEIEVRYKDGASYPDGGSGQKYNVDICPECFKDKLIPWLESQGCKAKFEDWDW